MKTLYMVSHGEYSEYHIEAIFSTKEQAKEYIDSKGSYYRDIEEIELDVPIEKNNIIFHIEMNYDSGEIIRIENWGYLNSDTVEYNSKDIIKFNIESNSEKKAVKIVSDRLMQVKALEGIKYPKRYESYYDKNSNNLLKLWNYCTFDYNTGKVIE